MFGWITTAMFGWITTALFEWIATAMFEWVATAMFEWIATAMFEWIVTVMFEWKLRAHTAAPLTAATGRGTILLPVSKDNGPIFCPIQAIQSFCPILWRQLLPISWLHMATLPPFGGGGFFLCAPLPPP